MRKVLCALLVCVLLLTALPFAMAAEKAAKDTEADLGTATVETDSGSLNMRKKPSKQSDLVIRVPNGATVTLLEDSDTTDDWSHISYKNKKGYVMTSYLVPNDGSSAPEKEAEAGDDAAAPEEAAADAKADAKTDGKADQAAAPAANAATAGKTITAFANPSTVKTVNEEATLLSVQSLRALPDLSADGCGTLAAGVKVTVTAIDGGWCKVTKNVFTGYLPVDYLSYDGVNPIGVTEISNAAKTTKK